jgi:hypothetical protein
MKEPYGEGLGAAMLAAVPAGESPAGGTCSVATVAISGGGKGDWPVESPTDRGDDGNGGIIRSPIRAIVPPDRATPTPSHAWSVVRLGAKR